MPVNSFDDYYMSWRPKIERGKKALYLMIAEQLENDIKQGVIFSGVFKAGDKIGVNPFTYPGMKTAAKMLGIQLIPISQENGEMSREGILYACKQENIYKFKVYKGEFEMKQYVVDAFTEKVFSGNPAAICVLDSWLDEKIVRELNPNLDKVKIIDGLLLHATASGKDTDSVSRSFAPKLNVPEDPVCGSGHCHIAPYWINKLNKNSIVAYQASPRGGTLYCTKYGDRVRLSGKAALYSEADINIG